MLIDLDTPDREHFLHWVVMNIEYDKLPTGDVVLPYLQGAPYYGSGDHRFIFLVFEQEGKADINAVLSEFKDRNCGKFMKLAKRLNLGTPVVSPLF